MLFPHDADLLARYFDEGGRALLVALQNAARRPAQHSTACGCCARPRSRTQPSHLDGRTVEVIGESVRTFLPGAFLDHLGEMVKHAA